MRRKGAVKSPAYTKTVVSLGDLKQAALYFDYVIPMNILLDLIRDRGAPTQRDDLEFHFGKNWLSRILPPALVINQKLAERLSDVNILLTQFVLKLISANLERKPADIGLTEEEYHSIDQRATKCLVEFINDFGASDLPVDIAPSLMTEGSDANLVISSLKLIDTSRASWAQILEFRSDNLAQEKLRRLRLFAYTNYRNKPKSYIEDDILRRIDEHRSVVRKWGFETKSSAINMALSSKSIAGGLAGSFAATLFATPVTALGALAGGAIIELGRISLYVVKRNFALQELLQNNPISYIEDARAQLSQTQSVE